DGRAEPHVCHEEMTPTANPLPSENAPASPPKRRRRSPYRRPGGRPAQHGAVMLTRVLRTVRLNTIDQRSQIGVAMRRLRQELVAQLGGPEEVTPAVELLVEEICKKALITRAVGEFILRQENLVREGKSGPELLRVVEQHDRLQAAL